MTDRGVSETVGFVLVFALVTTTIGIVYTAGFSGLQDAQGAEQVENMERAFDVLDDNLADLSLRGVPSRSTEIKLAGGRIGVGESIAVHLRTDSTEPRKCNTDQPVTLASRPLVYEHGDTEVVYSLGAVFRSDGNDTAMLSSPPWVNDSGRGVAPITVTRGGEPPLGIAGRTTVLVVAQREATGLSCHFGDPDADLRVNVTIESPRAPAWERYFEDRGYDITASGDEVVTAKFNTGRFYAPRTTVEIEFNR